jgi:hypothetical protein
LSEDFQALRNVAEVMAQWFCRPEVGRLSMIAAAWQQQIH